MKPGMSTPTGQPSIQTGFRQSRQRWASNKARTSSKPAETSRNVATRARAGCSIAGWRGILTRSGGFRGLDEDMARLGAHGNASLRGDPLLRQVGSIAEDQLVEVHLVGVELGAVDA